MEIELASQLIAWFNPQERYVVALSGGVDSAVVAQAAVLSPANIVAVTGIGPATSSQERQDAERVVRLIEIEHHWIQPDEHLSQQYQRNDLQRCYYCKSHLFAAIQKLFPNRTILTGTNLDDLGDFRPGLEAARQANVRSPLAELQIAKSQVRQLAAHWRLPLADKPASPCLASRLAYGVEVTVQRLARIEAAEELIKTLLQIRDCRVRLHPDELARIELPLEQLPQAMRSGKLPEIATELVRLGFRYVTVDLAGQRSGSLNPTESQVLHNIVLTSNRS